MIQQENLLTEENDHVCVSVSDSSLAYGIAAVFQDLMVQ